MFYLSCMKVSLLIGYSGVQSWLQSTKISEKAEKDLTALIQAMQTEIEIQKPTLRSYMARTNHCKNRGCQLNGQRHGRRGTAERAPKVSKGKLPSWGF